MKYSTLQAAISEAERFLARAKLVVKKYEGNKVEQQGWLSDYPKEQAAVTRASMDLTRSLADLRAWRLNAIARVAGRSK